MGRSDGNNEEYDGLDGMSPEAEEVKSLRDDLSSASEVDALLRRLGAMKRRDRVVGVEACRAGARRTTRQRVDALQRAEEDHRGPQATLRKRGGARCEEKIAEGV